jgi:probable rRNA maturation factor
MKRPPAALSKRRGNRVLLSAVTGLSQAKRLTRVARRFLRALGLSNVELSVSLVGDARIRALNRAWRGKDRATDVLSFPSGDNPPVGVRPLGDVVISLATARRAAKEHEVSLEQELDRYLAHGLLHLLGHDHHRRAEARRMARAERRLLGSDGMLGPVPRR